MDLRNPRPNSGELFQSRPVSDLTYTVLWLSCLLACDYWFVSAQAAEAQKWKTGEKFSLQLESTTGITWSSQKLRMGLQNLAARQEVAIWLDRRIDPDQQPVFSIADVSLEQCLQNLAAGLDAGTCRVGAVVFFGKKSAASRLATIAALKNDEVAKFPPDVQTRLSPPRPWQWEELSTPRELLDQLARDAMVQIEGLEKIPHDLWAAGDLPPLTFSERLTLVLAGFDLSFQFADGGKNVRLTAMPEKPVLVRNYVLRGASIPQLAKAVPAALIKREAARIAVTGTAEEQEVVRRLVAGEKIRIPGPAPPKTVYTMKADNKAIGIVLNTLQVQANLTVEFDPSIKEKLYQRVSFDVQGATLDELLTAALRGSGLKYQLIEKRLVISLEP